MPSIPSYRISGIAVSSRDGSAIPRCRLSLSRSTSSGGRLLGQRGAAPDTAPEVVEADDQGHFSIPVSSAGRWLVSATARGYRTQWYDQHEEFSSAIVLTPSAPALNVVFKLDPDVIVAGTVLDEAAEPIRGASVQAVAARQAGPDAGRQPFSRGRFNGVTDDRGHYEIAGLPAADYRVSVQAQPWYATAARNTSRPAPNGAATTPELDPSLDVVYPLTWFPGVDDAAAADVLSIHPGEIREADFNLNPVPSAHLRLSSSLLPEAPGSRDQWASPILGLQRLGPDGFSFVNAQVTVGSSGQIDVGGLAPGLYRLQAHGGPPEQGEKISFLRVPGGTQTSIDASSAVEAARLNLQIEGAEDPGRIGVTLIDVSTGVVFRPDTGQRGFRRRQPRGDAQSDPAFEVPEGRYEVVLSGGGQDVFLHDVVINGSPAAGRLISVHRGDNLLVVHVASGRAAVHGIASLDGKPVAGAMVLLVPASFGDPGSIPVLRRDQTNTDGSFALANVIPGQYILAVVDHGWQVNWRAASELERYLLHGFPLSLKGGDDVDQGVSAQMP